MTPQELCDGVSPRFKVGQARGKASSALADLKPTGPRRCRKRRLHPLHSHHRGASQACGRPHLGTRLSPFAGLRSSPFPSSQRELDARGFIYKSSYAGWYAVSDEAYYTRGQVVEVVDPKTGEKYFVSLSLRRYKTSLILPNVSDLHRVWLARRVDGRGQLQVPPIGLPRAPHRMALVLSQS
jgi:hypothetical protein